MGYLDDMGDTMTDVAPEPDIEPPGWLSTVTGAVVWDRLPTPNLPGQPVPSAPQPGQLPGTGMGPSAASAGP